MKSDPVEPRAWPPDTRSGVHGAERRRDDAAGSGVDQWSLAIEAVGARREDAARRAAPAPANLFDSKVVRSGKVPVDVDITGANELWLLIEDVDSYDPARVIAEWVGCRTGGTAGCRETGRYSSPKIPSSVVKDLRGKGFTRFRRASEYR